MSVESHPLDALDRGNCVCGRRGVTEYRFVVPFGAEAVIADALAEFRRSGLAPSLCTLKRFGAADAAPLSFPHAWTDARRRPGARLGALGTTDRLDECVAGAGGRVQPAKDGRLRPAVFAAMYPRLAQWEEARRRLDPGGVFASELWRRCAHRSGEDHQGGSSMTRRAARRRKIGSSPTREAPCARLERSRDE